MPPPHLAQRLGHQPRIVRGRRVTTTLDLRIVEWTVRGEVNLDMVGQALAHGLNGVGLCGADGGMIRVTRRKPWTVDGEVVDFGWVGEIAHVNPLLFRTLLRTGPLPILAPVAADAAGRRYNVNADTVAGAVATALSAHILLLVTITGGIRRRAEEPETLLTTMNSSALQRGQAEGWITGGMQVKAQVGIEALKRGVRHVYVTGPGNLLQYARATRIVL